LDFAKEAEDIIRDRSYVDMSYNTTQSGLCAQKAELWLEGLGLEPWAAATDSGENRRIKKLTTQVAESDG
jgi:hypothetical protein